MNKSDISYMKFLITGCCGFIGSNLVLTLFERLDDIEIYGIDNFTDNYDVIFKKNNLSELEKHGKNFTFYNRDLLEDNLLEIIKPDLIIHLAAIPGVRKSLDDPVFYLRNNIETFIKLLEDAKKIGLKNVIYASSSSVYGKNKKVPFSEGDNLKSPQSSYACSKLSMEVYAKYYNDVFEMNTVGTRFFTVYGERGRPDMAPYMFLKAIAEEKEIKQFGDGTSYRDYTHVSDIVEGILKIANKMMYENKSLKHVYNLGRGKPVNLKKFIETCENIVGKKACVNEIENQTGDVHHTFADISSAKQDFNYNPIVTLDDGLKKAFDWMKRNNRIEGSNENLLTEETIKYY